MANRQHHPCKGKKSDSLCTCESINDCQKYSHSHNYDKATTPAQNIQNTQCSTDCANCKLLNRLYVLLQEIVDNRKNVNDAEEIKNGNRDTITKQLFRNDNEKVKINENLNDRKPSMRINRDTRKSKGNIVENSMTFPNKIDDKNCNIFNVYNNNEGSNHLLLCNCDKNYKEKTYSNHTNYKEDQTRTQTSKPNDGISCCPAQCWHSVGEIKTLEHVDCGCQCTCTCAQEGYSTQEDVKNNKNESKKCNCVVSDTNADSSIVQNLLNDPNFRDAMKLMPGPNIVVLTNGCNCCSKNNTTLERTSVTTNTSESVFTEQKKEEVPETSAKMENDLLTQDNNSLPGEGKSRESTAIKKSILENTRKSRKKSEIRSDLYEDTTFMDPQETELTVGAALVSKSGKKNKSSPKSKKRKSKANSDVKDAPDKKTPVISCCQTEKVIEERIICCKNNVKDAAICCDILKSQKPVEIGTTKHTPMIHENTDGCKCSEMQNFFANIIDIFTQMKQKSDEPIKGCECNSHNNNTARRKTVIPNTNKDACLEIQRLAEQIVEIHLKSNQNKESNRFSRNENKILYNTAKTSEYDLRNSIQVTALPKHESACIEECYCKMCPCMKCMRHDRKETCPKKKEKCKCTANPQVKRVTKKFNELEYNNLNKWTQEYPPAPEKNSMDRRQNCTCGNFECIEETEIGLLNYHMSDFPKESNNCQMETCPQLHRIAKECLCGTKHCYCHNEKLNEIKTTANLERLADEVINTLSPCNCMVPQCTCNKTQMGPEMTNPTTS